MKGKIYLSESFPPKTGGIHLFHKHLPTAFSAFSTPLGAGEKENYTTFYPLKKPTVQWEIPACQMIIKPQGST